MGHIPPQEATEELGDGKDTAKPEMAAESDTEPQEGTEGTARRYLSLEREREQREAIAATYRRQQEATKETERLRAELLKGIKAGEDHTRLLLLALECVAKATGDSVIFTQAAQDIETIHGKALGHPGALAVELEDLEGRLERLQKAANEWPDGEERRRIKAAIREHERRRAEILAAL